MRLSEASDYREYLRSFIKNLPDRGKGAISRMAKHLGVQTSMISQVLNGKKHFSLEQASAMAKYMNLSNDELDYFLLLVQRERASTKQLKYIFSRQIEQMRSRLSSSSEIMPEAYVIPKVDRNQFYSAWYYSGIRLATAIDETSDVDSLSKRFGLEKELVENVVNFLVGAGLCVQEKNKLKIGPARTHLEQDSANRSQHHLNWRIKGLNRVQQHSPPELFYSFPMCISEADTTVIRSLIFDLIKKIDDIVKPSKSEKLTCLNIDWFNF